MHKRNYPMIDIMRIIASILVIGIHTYPFLQISPSLDFITTHIIGRIAVPFFYDNCFLSVWTWRTYTTKIKKDT